MKNVLITGGTGSFGQAFTRRLLEQPRTHPGEVIKVPGGMDLRDFVIPSGLDRIVIYSRGEHLQEEMMAKFSDDRLRFFIGDVRDRDRLELAMRGIDTVVHAAALKVVPIAEYNPTECISTNIHGAENVVKAALRCGVKKVIGLSTDKAVNPINLYGASKLAAEKIFIAANSLSAGSCAFSVVRYGNVVGSRGSVIPLFKKLADGDYQLPVTHEDMTRFWITMDQAIDLVLNTERHMMGREIVIPKIPSMKVIDLAKAMDTNNRGIIITGIRPGEKLHECLLTEDEARDGFDAGDVYFITPAGAKTRRTPRWHALPEGFRYTSDGNTEWLTVEQLRAMI